MDILSWPAGLWSWVVEGWPGFVGLMTGEKAPWWGIPGVTGAATLVGALIALRSARASDDRKAKAEKEAKRLADTREAAQELLKVGREIENLVVGQETKTRSKPAIDYMNATMDVAMKLHQVWGTFELVSIESALKPGEDYYSASSVLAIPRAKSDERTAALDYAAIKRMEFINSLRTAAGLPAITRMPGKTISREELESDDAKKAEYLQVVTDLVDRHPPTPTKSNNDAKPKDSGSK
ncbi:hypothetical protein AAIH32_12785 [Pseudarthrobacter oxydans]|uniref:hypothetical protein n=1 Tax=Pseudarthrobacter oxydans TaxID=1671 RepID=UPI003D28E644